MRITAAIDDIYRFYPSYGEWALFTLLLGKYVIPYKDHFIHSQSLIIPKLTIKDAEYFGRVATATTEQKRGETLQTLGLYQSAITGIINLKEDEPPQRPTPETNHLGLEVAGVPQIRNRLFADSSQIVTFIDVNFDIEKNNSKGIIIYGNE